MHRGLTTLVVVLSAFFGVALVEYLNLRSGRFVECLLVFAAAACAAWAASGWLRNLAMVVCSLAIGVAILQGAVPLLFPKSSGDEARLSDEGLTASRDVFGWGPRHPGVFHLVKTKADGQVIYDVHATIDAAYNRKTVPSSGARSIAFFGDSFVFGDGLNDSETLPQAFADLNHGKIPVLNFGYSGWAPSQNLAALEKGLYSRELVAPRRVILFTSLFHIQRTACQGAFGLGSGPRYILAGAGVKYAGTCAGARSGIVASILRFVSALAFTSRPAPPNQRPTARDVETYIKIIETFAATARRNYHVGTTILMEPGGNEYVAGTGYDLAKIVDALRADGLDVIVKDDVPAALTRFYKIEGDGHPTALANRAIARMLETHLRTVDPDALQTDSGPQD